MQTLPIYIIYAISSVRLKCPNFYVMVNIYKNKFAKDPNFCL